MLTHMCWFFILSGERFREFLDELIGFIDNDDQNIINSKVYEFLNVNDFG